MEEKQTQKPSVAKFVALMADNEKLKARVSLLETSITDIVIYFTNNDKSKNDFLALIVENISNLPPKINQ